jgi:hypothetical protein
MKKLIFIGLLVLVSGMGFAVEHLDPKYCISYGNPKAPVKVYEYFSFSCPQCVRLFKESFSNIKDEFLDTNQVYWTFHPSPMDLLTVQAMACLRHLPDEKKQIFLEAMLAEGDASSPKIISLMMQKAMEIFGSPLPNLLEMHYLENDDSFRDAYSFINQSDNINEVPTVEINGNIYKEMPEKEFLQRLFGKLLMEKII